MSLPKFRFMMLPILVLLKDRKERTSQQILDYVADSLNISDEDRNDRLENGQTRLAVRRSWACTYLKNAGLISSPSKGCFAITQQGLDVLSNPPAVIDNEFLRQFKGFRDFIKTIDPRKNTRSPNHSETDTRIAESDDHTPEEIIEEQFDSIRSALADDLLHKVKECSPQFFERLVVDLIVKMGYGGSQQEAGQATRYSNDEGIDGIIKEDKLGLDVIYLQAKRWNGNVGRPELQNFAGALQGQRARKGIFITTSAFSSGAVEYCRHLDSKIILIDGKQLAELMIDYNVGVSTQRTLEIKRMDSDYFSEE